MTRLLFVALLFVATFALPAIVNAEPPPEGGELELVVEREPPVTMREYRLVFAPGFDLQTESVAGATLNRMLQDAYNYGLSPHLGSTANGILGTIWSIAVTYSTLLWPHEFGHWSRAQQVDGKFIFHGANPILPNTTVELPDDATFADRALLSVGGFEVNAMIARQAQLDFYERGGGWSDEMSHALLNESFFFIYTLIFPAAAREPETWVETRGDPVHVVLPVYQRYTGRDPIRADGSVDPELVSSYREHRWLSVGWLLLDPGFIQQALSFTDSGFDSRRAWMPIRTKRFAWTWGTLFNPSPLGYELHLNQYFLVDRHTFELSVKFGRPFQNTGVRLNAPDIIETNRLRLGAAIEGWSQGPYGLGGSAEVEADVRLVGGLGLAGTLGYKTEGYALGRAISQTACGSLGLLYRFDHGLKPRD